MLFWCITKISELTLNETYETKWGEFKNFELGQGVQLSSYTGLLLKVTVVN